MNIRTALGGLLIAAGVTIGAHGATATRSGDTGASTNEKVGICHNGHYQTVSQRSIINVPNGHHYHDGDIIPPFDYRLDNADHHYPGKGDYSLLPSCAPATTLPPTTLPPTTLPPTTLPPTTLPPTTLPSTTLPPTTVPDTTLPPFPPWQILWVQNCDKIVVRGDRFDPAADNVARFWRDGVELNGSPLSFDDRFVATIRRTDVDASHTWQFTVTIDGVEVENQIGTMNPCQQPPTTTSPSTTPETTTPSTSTPPTTGTPTTTTSAPPSSSSSPPPSSTTPASSTTPESPPTSDSPPTFTTAPPECQPQSPPATTPSHCNRTLPTTGGSTVGQQIALAAAACLAGITLVAAGGRRRNI